MAEAFLEIEARFLRRFFPKEETDRPTDPEVIAWINHYGAELRRITMHGLEKGGNQTSPRHLFMHLSFPAQIDCVVGGN